MPDFSPDMVPTGDDTLTFAQRVRVNLLMLASAFRYSHLIGQITEKATRVAEAGQTHAELVALHGIANARYCGGLPPLAARMPPVQLHCTRSLEGDESPEAYLERGNAFFAQSTFDLAYYAYFSALEAVTAPFTRA